MKQYRIENCLIGGTVVINLKGLNDREIVIPNGGFCFLKEEELSWVLSQSKIFERGILRVVSPDELPTDIREELPVSKDAVTKTDISYFLGLTQAKLTKELQEITREDFLRELAKGANEADKSVKFVQVIENRIEELLEKKGL